jgi:hypothetical protein
MGALMVLRTVRTALLFNGTTEEGIGLTRIANEPAAITAAQIDQLLALLDRNRNIISGVKQMQRRSLVALAALKMAEGICAALFLWPRVSRLAGSLGCALAHELADHGIAGENRPKLLI